MKELLGELVAIPSHSGKEGRIAAFIAYLCRVQGHEVWMVNGSVAVRIKGLNRRFALILNGHLDTVPVEWPGAYHMILRGNLLEGSGVTDMKSGLAVMGMIAKIHRFTPPPCDMWLFFSREEETTAQGSLDLAAWWSAKFSGSYAKKAVIILEPTANSFVAFSHKGGGVFQTTIEGESFHGSRNLADKITAVERACKFGSSLKAIQRRWLQNYADIEYGPATINLTRVYAGTDVLNVVPSSAEVGVDIRTNSLLGTRQLTREFRAFERRFGVTFQIDSMRGAEVVTCENRLPLMTAFAAAAPEVSVAAFPAATDMTAFLQVGLSVAIFGPGNESLHRKRENLEEGAMETCLSCYVIPVMRAFSSQY